jgi:hypothetical protein
MPFGLHRGLMGRVQRLTKSAFGIQERTIKLDVVSLACGITHRKSPIKFPAAYHMGTCRILIGVAIHITLLIGQLSPTRVT